MNFSIDTNHQEFVLSASFSFFCSRSWSRADSFERQRQISVSTNQLRTTDRFQCEQINHNLFDKIFPFPPFPLAFARENGKFICFLRQLIRYTSNKIIPTTLLRNYWKIMIFNTWFKGRNLIEGDRHRLATKTQVTSTVHSLLNLHITKFSLI